MQIAVRILINTPALGVRAAGLFDLAGLAGAPAADA